MHITTNRAGRGRTRAHPRILAPALGVVLLAVLGLTGCRPVPLVLHDGRDVVRWNPCRTIEYQIDPAGGEMTFTPDIHEAFQAASMASGIPIHYAGRADPHHQHSDDHDPVLVRYGDAAGTGGWAEPAIRGDEIVGGVVTIEPSGYGSSHRMHRRLVFHEVGHIFGLDHPAIGRTSQVMGTAMAPYREGDLAGLQMVGRHRGDRC